MYLMIQYNILKRETNNASGKAKNDVSQILHEEGVRDLYIPSKHRLVRFIQRLKILSKVDKESIIFIQYPSISDRQIDRLKNRLKGKGKIIGIVHDIKSLRSKFDIVEEIDILKSFDILIVHNYSMLKYMRESGYNNFIVNLELFDYLHDIKRKVKETKLEKTICFAGNLDKSLFLKDLNKLSDLNFNLYGIIDNQAQIDHKNVFYKGKYSSEEIAYNLEGGFGLIWDGHSLENCNGINGNYQRYNSPHKLSLYLAAGKPLIVWDKAATSEFVKKNKIGIVVESLHDIQKKINSMSEKEYKFMQENVIEMKKLIADGFFTRKALASVIEILNKNPKRYL